MEALEKSVLLSIASFLASDRDLLSFALASKSVLGALGEALFQRWHARRLPWDLERVRELAARRYGLPLEKIAALSPKEQHAVVQKLFRDLCATSRGPKWLEAAFAWMVDNALCGSSAREKAVFYLWQLFRDPSLRTERIFEDDELLHALMQLFDFRGLNLFEAMHLCFGAIGLPGEAQKIDRVLTRFSRVLYESATSDLKEQYVSPDSLFVLCFAIVMLNSDLHSGAVKQRMTLAQFRHNLRGTIQLSERESLALYSQVMRCEMVLQQGAASFSAAHHFYEVSHYPIIGWKRATAPCKLEVTGGQLVINGRRVGLEHCCVARNICNGMNMLHLVPLTAEDERQPDSVLGSRFTGSHVVLTCEHPGALARLQRQFSMYMLPKLQSGVHATLRKLAAGEEHFHSHPVHYYSPKPSRPEEAEARLMTMLALQKRSKARQLEHMIMGGAASSSRLKVASRPRSKSK